MLLRRQEPSPAVTTITQSQTWVPAYAGTRYSLRMNKRGYVYLMASGQNGTLYLGVTNDLIRRAWEHRNGVGGEFSSNYECRFLVWYEAHDDLQEARLRELQMKKWKRAWKLRLIEEDNPGWCDLFDQIV